MQNRFDTSDSIHPTFLPFVAIVLAATIFIFDTFSPFGMAVAVLYVIVVLISANFCDRRGLLMVAVACAALTFLAFTVSHGTDYESSSFARCLVSLAAIAIAAILALKNKATENALRRSEAYLSEAQRLSHTGSFSWNVDTGDILWSDETYRIFALDPSVLPTLSIIIDRVHPDDRDDVRRLLRRAEEKRQNWHLEHRLLLPDGTVKFVNVVAHGSDLTSGQFEFVGAIMDETAAKRAELDLSQARANLAHVNRVTTLGEMSASIAHEVAQPIGAIVTNAGAGMRWLGAEPPELDETRKVLGRILKDGNRANEVITRIRAMSRKMPTLREAVSVNRLVKEVIALVRAEAERGNVTLQLNLAPDLPLIACDRVQVQQVILNLIVNAIEAMSGQQDRPRKLEVRSLVDATGNIVVVVADTGPGFEPDQIDRIFDAFFTTKPQGLGMGLAICRSIIEAHDGRLWAEAGQDGGAVFQLLLPVDAGDEKQSDSP